MAEQWIDEGYMELVGAFPLRRLHDDADLDAAIAVVDRLLDSEGLSAGEREYLHALAILIESYENEHLPTPNVSGVDVLRYLMEEHGLRQIDLLDTFGTKSIVSEVLSGKRKLTVGHIAALSERFHLPADVFIDRSVH